MTNQECFHFTIANLLKVLSPKAGLCYPYQKESAYYGYFIATETALSAILPYVHKSTKLTIDIPVGYHAYNIEHTLNGEKCNFNLIVCKESNYYTVAKELNSDLKSLLYKDVC